jgi:hypothetical protein
MEAVLDSSMDMSDITYVKGSEHFSVRVLMFYNAYVNDCVLLP